MRSKEEAHDYRYFPNPICRRSSSTRRVGACAATMPELPEARAVGSSRVRHSRLRRRRADAVAALADYFEATAAAANNAKAASNWIMGELLRTLNERGLEIADAPLQPERSLV